MYILENGKKFKIIKESACGYWTEGGHFFKKQYHVAMLENHEKLEKFIKENNINMSGVSRYLGKTRSWLAMSCRGNLSDAKFKEIMRKLHIDWTSSQYINVKKTKEHIAYRTKPSSYNSDMHKSRLQKSMWNGEFVK